VVLCTADHAQANVFSTCDNFSYTDPKTGQKGYLTRADADYFVLGWHSDPNDDPLFPKQIGNLDRRLENLLLELDKGTDAAPDADAVKLGEKSTDSTRILCYSAMYNVSYNQKKRAPSKAEKATKNFTRDVAMEPISIGCSPLDGVLTFLVS